MQRTVSTPTVGGNAGHPFQRVTRNSGAGVALGRHAGVPPRQAENHRSGTVRARPEMLELYRLRWDIADLAVGVHRFATAHSGTADDDQTWAIVRRIVTSAPPR
jgi:hypothetical protein